MTLTDDLPPVLNAEDILKAPPEERDLYLRKYRGSSPGERSRLDIGLERRGRGGIRACHSMQRAGWCRVWQAVVHPTHPRVVWEGQGWRKWCQHDPWLAWVFFACVQRAVPMGGAAEGLV